MLKKCAKKRKPGSKKRNLREMAFGLDHHEGNYLTDIYERSFVMGNQSALGGKAFLQSLDNPALEDF